MAIRIYTSYKNFDKKKIVIDNDAFFGLFVDSKEFGKLDEEVMLCIDNAKLIDKRTGAIITPIGVTTIDTLSTGCKTVLNYLYLLRDNADAPEVEAIDASYCGRNALEKLFEIMEDNDKKEIPITLLHRDGTFRCSDREYIINDKKTINKLLYM